MPRPDKADRLPPMSAGGGVTQTARHAVETPGGAAPPGHILKPTFVFFESTDWTLDTISDLARQAASILSQCGVAMPMVDVRLLKVPPAHRYFHDAIAKDLVQRFTTPRPAVYFVRDTLQTEAYDAEAIGRGNSAGRRSLRDTVWVTEGTRDPGVALAHELVHVLMDSGRHVDIPDNLMQDETTPGNSKLTPEQCDELVRNGTANGLLVPPAAPPES